jgi:glutaredoxin
MSNKNKINIITIYTNETCPYCKQIKKELNKANIEFNERLVKDWPAKWQEIINLTGLAITPTINYNEEYFIPGRDYMIPKQLIKLLTNKKSIKYIDNYKIVVEKIKTLNYNMAAAFKQLDQVLKQIETKINK